MLFSAVSALTACGGGGGGGGDPGGFAAPPPPTAPLTYADCVQNPTGTDSTYLNSFRPRRVWEAATFEGEAVTARKEYASSGTTPTRIWYYKYDSAAQTVATVGHEELNTSGTVTLRERFTGFVNGMLAAGQTETVNYTVTTLLPAGQADRSERLTLTYDGNEVITLPGGRVDTCKVTATLASVSGGTATQISVESLNLARGLGFVKSYYKPTLSSFSDRNQTYLTELVSTNGSISYQADTADTAPGLTACSAVANNANFVITASTQSEANNAFRSTSSATFNGTAAFAEDRRNAATNNRTQTDYFDAGVGYLRSLGFSIYGSTGNLLVQSVTQTGRPDLRQTPPLSTVNYSETFTVIVPAGGGSNTSNDSFTFEGYAKVTTPAGTFDTCRVRFDFSDGVSQTFWYAPNLHWVRLETRTGGVRTTRELISR
ncbi:hypothetical protein [Piscinibacter sp. XHJ-5]|uniref:hypothetical protein n=1 Tax=Piscinibacter sp. XHJ-5 TaxID=3037797 RepID=UPI0024536104|nr:hypothetical protein [Piscinibacter sp. XHJ-5]